MSFQRLLGVAAAVAVLTSALSVPSWALRAPCPPDHANGREPNTYTDKGEAFWVYNNRLADLKRVDGICVRMEGSPSDDGTTWTSTKGDLQLRQGKGGEITTLGRMK